MSWNVSKHYIKKEVELSASLWGCELKCERSQGNVHWWWSASLWGCELKYALYPLLLNNGSSASLWGCELKYISGDTIFSGFVVSLLVRLWVEIPYWSGWNDNVLVSLLVRLWVEIRNRKRPTSQMWSASLWGCELKCRVPRIWLFHCNRQIILRSGIKSLQPFERWSNLLQVTCDLW